MQVDDSVGEAADDVPRLLLAEETFPLQQLLQFTSVAQLHDQINHLEIRRALNLRVRLSAVWVKTLTGVPASQIDRHASRLAFAFGGGGGGAHPRRVVHTLQMDDVGVIDLLEDGNFLLQHLDS